MKLVVANSPSPLNHHIQFTHNMVAELKKLAASAAGKHAAYKKYTVQPTGIWKRIGDFFAVDPKRSSGIPLNPQYRLPSPGAVDPKLYDDPTTVPAADLAENPYWKRDVRRSYPKLSVVKQPDVVALLTVGSAQNPKEHVLQIGDAGAKQLVSVKEEGQKGLSAFFQKENKAGVSVLGPNGLPPFPTSRYPSSTPKRYEMLKEQAYSAKYAFQRPLTRATVSLTLPTATLAGCSSRSNEHVHFLFLRRSKFDMA
ncbi:NADH dehydrogenase 29/21K chain [Aureobasidium pullulans]|uniref:NADH dehydrogenase 29/21K chain n=1 Tax=Aureobasidium pullulans TaxID=5580 RepID=A0A4S9AIZ1_AURPU|nr:NADH dehydrogenase 29/21K chain [Aureobasidium pullulans]THW79564.1 NADH dehydrogenase 29/21K chain [Aureobasidium pullulans]TIA04618.1 NADH dehydrogenase 29/21K chain [Aureobasidium pullulans]